MSTIVVPSEKPIQTDRIAVLVHPIRLLMMRNQLTDGIQGMVLTLCMVRLIWTVNKDGKVVDHLKAIDTGKPGPKALESHATTQALLLFLSLFQQLR